jgi:hypothetical protein
MGTRKYQRVKGDVKGTDILEKVKVDNTLTEVTTCRKNVMDHVIG